MLAALPLLPIDRSRQAPTRLSHGNKTTSVLLGSHLIKKMPIPQVCTRTQQAPRCPDLPPERLSRQRSIRFDWLVEPENHMLTRASCNTRLLLFLPGWLVGNDWADANLRTCMSRMLGLPITGRARENKNAVTPRLCCRLSLFLTRTVPSSSCRGSGFG